MRVPKTQFSDENYTGNNVLTASPELERSLDQTVRHLENLIAFPTVTTESNLALIDYVRDELEQHGARTVITHDEDGGKANVFATIGPDVDGGVVLSGHTDVVPVSGQTWDTDPFAAHIADGKIYGRGSCDMKGFIAAALAKAPQFAEAKLERPVHFAFTYDEEIGCFGAPVMLAELARHGPKPAVAIVGEPTGMRIIEGHKSGYEFTTEFAGLEGHASQPDYGVNAIEYAVRYIAKLLELAEGARAQPGDAAFDPPWTTVNVGQIQGGIARNVIAKSCSVEWEIRSATGGEADNMLAAINDYAATELVPQMRNVHPQADIVNRVISAVGPFERMPESEAVALVASLTGSNSAGVVSFSTEAGLFQAAGIAAVVCGPGHIDQAHKPNEFVERAQLGACLTMLDGLVGKLSQTR